MTEILKQCPHPGCHALIPRSAIRCALHLKQERQEYDRKRKDDPLHTFYTHKHWRDVRRQHLLDEPFCVECRKLGRMIRASVVDHRVPVRRGGGMYESDNLQSLCASCHSRKSIIEGSRYGK